jgi:hypothetical protein
MTPQQEEEQEEQQQSKTYVRTNVGKKHKMSTFQENKLSPFF